MHLLRHALLGRHIFLPLPAVSLPPPRRALFLLGAGRCFTSLSWPRCHLTARAFATQSKAVEEDAKRDGGGFFAEEGVSWESLGISDHLSRALARVSLHKPSAIQSSRFSSPLLPKPISKASSFSLCCQNRTEIFPFVFLKLIEQILCCSNNCCSRTWSITFSKLYFKLKPKSSSWSFFSFTQELEHSPSPSSSCCTRSP